VPEETTYKISDKMFGEGVAALSPTELIMLTWQSRKMLIFDKLSLTLKAEVDLPREIKEGWGVTSKPMNDSQYHELYISDGTSVIKVVEWSVKNETNNSDLHSANVTR